MNLYLLRLRIPAAESWGRAPDVIRGPRPCAIVRAPDSAMACNLVRLLSGNKGWLDARVEELARDVLGAHELVFNGLELVEVR